VISNQSLQLEISRDMCSLSQHVGKMPLAWALSGVYMCPLVVSESRCEQSNDRCAFTAVAVMHADGAGAEGHRQEVPGRRGAIRRHPARAARQRLGAGGRACIPVATGGNGWAGGEGAGRLRTGMLHHPPPSPFSHPSFCMYLCGIVPFGIASG
jgi:hypothetical protein